MPKLIPSGSSLQHPRVRRAGRAGIAGALLAAFAFLGNLVTGGCRLATPFRGSETPLSPDSTVVVAITHAELGGPGRRAFDRYTDKVIQSLPDNDGYVGHAVRGRLFGHEVWTMTVWRDEAATDAFVRSSVHKDAIREGLPAVTRAQFLRFEWPAADLPPSWDEVDQRLESTPFIDYSRDRSLPASTAPASPAPPSPAPAAQPSTPAAYDRGAS